MKNKYFSLILSILLSVVTINAEEFSIDAVVAKAKADPKNAPTIVAAAAVANPNYVLDLVEAAVKAMPDQAVEIVRAVLKALPKRAPEILDRVRDLIPPDQQIALPDPGRDLPPPPFPPQPPNPELVSPAA